MNLSKNQIKYIRSLQQSKFRQMYENFVAEGDKVVTELLQKNNFDIELVAALPEWISSNSNKIERYTNLLYTVDNEQMEQISSLKSAPDVLIIAKKRLTSLNEILNNNFKAFYLDGLQDPGNVGTVIRIADWFGFDAVIKSEDTADFFHPKVVQASMGSISDLHLCELNRSELVALQAIDLYILDMEGKPIEEVTFSNKSIFILGSEGKGISDVIKQKMDKNNFITIKGSNNRVAESLNVGVAAGILAQKVFTNSFLT
jgi:RNA methyltransferase, TrmH family